MGGFSLSFTDEVLILVALALFILLVVFYLIFLVRATNTQIKALDSGSNKQKAIAIPLLLVVWIPVCILVFMLLVHGYDKFLFFNAGSIIMGILISVLIHMIATRSRRKTSIILIGLLLLLLFLFVLILHV